MAWPLSQDYNEAIQNPGSAFSDAELRRGEPATNALGLPMPRSGNFADVYEFRCPGRKWAVKCFTREVPGLRDRYREVSTYLRRLNLPFMVDFNYLDEGIRIRGKWYPVLKMHWVEGLTLNEFAREHVDKPQTLEVLSQIWLRLSRRLRESRVAHCDLQHGNALLVPGARASALAVKLIDYDGMHVPALAKRKSGELGHPAYQHPQRLREGTYSTEVDRFPNLVIYCALRGLIAGGRLLWDRYDNGDNLLFRQKDLEAPHDSAVFDDLRRLGDPELRPLVEALSQAAKQPLHQTPLLEELVPNDQATSSGISTRRLKAVSAGGGQMAGFADSESADAVFAASTALDEPVYTRRRGRSGRKPSSLPWILVAGSAALVVILTAVIVLLLNRGGGEPPAVARTGPDNLDVQRPNDAPKPPDPQRRPPGHPPAVARANAVNDLRHPPGFDRLATATVQTKSKWVGGGFGGIRFGPFDDVRPHDFLVGFDLFPATNADGEYIAGIAPVYRGLTGALMPAHGKSSPPRIRSMAREGYAVGGIRIEGNSKVNGLQITFMRIDGNRLNPDDVYYSPWLAGHTIAAGQHLRLGGDGNPVVGIYGSCEPELDRLGFIQIGRRIPVPVGPVLSQAAKKMRDRFKELYARQGAPAKRALAATLLQEAAGSREPATRLALLTDAWSMAAQGLDHALAMKIIDLITEEYNISNRLEMKAIALELATWAVQQDRGPQQKGRFRALAAAVPRLSDEGVATHDFVGARRLLKAAHAAAERAQDNFMVTWTQAGLTELEPLVNGAKSRPAPTPPKPPPPAPLKKQSAPKTGPKELFTLEGHTGAVLSVAVAPDGHSALSGSADDTIRTWNLETGKAVGTAKECPAAHSLAIYPRGELVASGSRDGSIRLWQRRKGQLSLVREFRRNGFAPVVDFVVGPPRILAVHASNQVRSCPLDLTTDSIYSGRLWTQPFVSLAVSADRRYALLGALDGSALLWDAQTRRDVGRLNGPPGQVLAVALSRDGRRAVTAGMAAMIVWNLKTGKELHRLEGHRGNVLTVAFSRDSRRILSGGADNTVRLWDAGTGTELRRFERHEDTVRGVAFTPDGRSALSASDDKTLRVWALPPARD